MEGQDWSALLEADDEEWCLSRENCIEELLQDAPAGCLFCLIRDLSEGDDE